MHLYGIRHLVAVRDSQAVGIVSDRDLGGPHGIADLKPLTVGNVMTPNLIIATPRMTVREAANLLRGHMIGCLPVMENGKVKGIITITDLLNLFGRGTQTPRRGQFRRPEYQMKPPMRSVGRSHHEGRAQVTRKAKAIRPPASMRGPVGARVK